MQLAALTAVIVYFRSDLGSMIRAGVDTVRKRDFDTPELSLAMGTLVATIPIAVAGAALSNILNQCQSPLRQPILIGTASVFVAGLMGAAEYFAKHKRPVTQFGYRDAILVGLAQVGALIPGVSRSGATLTASLALGFRREDAARVSFLLGVPAIALAGFHELWILHQSGLPARGWFALGIGLMVSSLSAFLAIWGLMRFLERHSTWMLILYRAAFGLLLIVAAAEGWIR
jgi:undecaprenyl-diphosphatase